MDKKHYIITITVLALLLSLTACTQKEMMKNIGDLILNPEMIDEIDIYQGQEGTPTATITNMGDINRIIKKVSSISIKKLTKHEDANFMISEQRMLRKDILWVEFKANSKICGKFAIWKDGAIYVVDINSMKSSSRTIAYKSKEIQPSIYTLFVAIINKTGISKNAISNP